MQPHIFGVRAFVAMWIVAAVCGIGVGTQLARREGFPLWRSVVALACFAVTILLGSKLQYILEHLVFPVDDPAPAGASALQAFWHGFRIPGGILLLAPVFPIVCGALRLPTLRFVDAVIPAAGVSLSFIRLGCLANGCCFARPTNFRVAMTFPSGARVTEWQRAQGLIAPTASASLPVHPLQIYFAVLGAALYVLGRRWQTHKQFDGEVWAKFYVLFFGATFVLELLRPTVLHLNLIVTATVVALTLWARGRARPVPTVAVGVPS